MQHLLGHLDVIKGTEVLTCGLHQVGLVRVLLIEAGELLDVARDAGIGELLFELLKSDDDFLKLVAHDISFMQRDGQTGANRAAAVAVGAKWRKTQLELIECDEHASSSFWMDIIPNQR